MSNKYTVKVVRTEDFEIEVEAERSEAAELIALHVLQNSNDCGGEFSTSRCDEVEYIEHLL